MEKLDSDNQFLFEETFSYERLPRYVNESPTDKTNLLAVKRTIEWGGQKLVLIITPACAVNALPHGMDFDPRALFPGAEEERIEMALRQLSVEANINFDGRIFALCFSFTELKSVYSQITDEPNLTKDRLEKSLFVLFDSSYVLKRGTTEYYFRAIKKINWVKQQEEKYYCIHFSPVFFDRCEIFDQIFGKPKIKSN